MCKKKPNPFGFGFRKAAITYSPTLVVPSALQGLTSLFGMGRGGALVLSSPEYPERDADAESVEKTFSTSQLAAAATLSVLCYSAEAEASGLGFSRNVPGN